MQTPAPSTRPPSYSAKKRTMPVDPFDALRAEAAANMYAFLASHGIRTTYIGIANDQLIMLETTMVPVSVTVSFVARGDAARRTKMPEATGLIHPEVEFRLRSEDVWRGKRLACRTPLIILQGGKTQLHYPDRPISRPFLELIAEDDPCAGMMHAYGEMSRLALLAALHLEVGVRERGDALHNVTLNFGRHADGHLLIADGLNPDAWMTRNRADGVRYQKRDGNHERHGRTDYRRAVELTHNMRNL